MQNSSIVTDPLWESPSKALSANNAYDVAIIGSGVSCAYTVIHYIALLLQQPPVQPIKLAVLDKAGEFWAGVAYGNRTGQHSLIISSLREFFPQPELDNFQQWLNHNRHQVFDTPALQTGVLASQWLKVHEPAMAAGQWEELFIPRYTVSLYLQERIDRLLQTAQAQGVLECSLLTADVENIQRVNDAYQIIFKSPAAASISLLARKVVLAIGSPPNKSNQLAPTDTLGNELCYIENMYEPSQNSNIDRIYHILKTAPHPHHHQVLIVGSNASALETIYSLNNNPAISNLINKFIVISNGGFPHRICPAAAPDQYVANHLQALLQSPDPTSQKILEAVKLDVAAALAQNETVGSTYAIISKGVIANLQQLSLAEQKLFVSGYGVEIGKYQRRAGSDYLDVVEQLQADGKLELLQGKFIRTLLLDNQEQGFEFIDGQSQQQQIFTTPVRVAINCAGFQDLNKSSSTLIKNLIAQGICTPNDSQNGFDVNENFEASPNFYILGPLIAGNINQKFKIWHAESCARIINLSQQLAEILIQQ
jgi:uncharacterized NAD(P)/FAD-binding protein YdhS